MIALPAAVSVGESLVAFSIVGVAALVVDTVVERIRPGRNRKRSGTRTAPAASTTGPTDPSDPSDPSILDRVVVIIVVLGAAAALLAGVELGPTGVWLLDVILAFALLVAVPLATDGSARTGGLAAGVPILAAAGGYALAAFGHDADLALVMAGVTALAVVTTVTAGSATGRWLRVLIGFGIALGALLVDVVPGAGRSVLTPLLLTGLLAIDAGAVVIARLRRRESWVRPRADHLVDRLESRGWGRRSALALLVLVQAALSGLAVFSGRAVLATWIAAALGAALLLAVGVAAARATVPPAPDRRVGRWFALGAIVLVVLAVLSLVPVALAANASYDAMERGRDAAKTGLSAARDGKTEAATQAFQTAAREFATARDELDSPLVLPSLAVPYVASNVRAARTLASIGNDLADAGEAVTTAVQPSALDVIDGRLPLAGVAEITPTLEEAAAELVDAEARLQTVSDDPNVVPQIRDAVDEVEKQVTKAAKEARHAVLAAKLAPALFGQDGPRRYLLVVQNNAESRATGGFIGNYGVLTADDGKLHVDRLKRTREWNEALAVTKPPLQGPADYVARYGQFSPETTLQNVNLSPDFPSVAKVLMNLAPSAGVGPVDGVIAIDPAGLAALLELTGPIEVEGWPEPIDAHNVVDIALKEEYTAFAETPERADFLGDIAQAAVEKATSENLGRPPQIAKVLGKAAHEGHFTFAFARPEEELLARDLGIDGALRHGPGDSLAVTTSNAGANKIDAYFRRTITADVRLTPASDGQSTGVTSVVSVAMTNEAPAAGLPQIVIGPYKEGFVAGENRSIVSLYSPLRIGATEVDGQPDPFVVGDERGQEVASDLVKIPAESTKTVTAHLDGRVELHDGWYSLRVDHQPTYKADAVKLTISVPSSWRIDKAVRAHVDGPHRASAELTLERATTVRVHIVRPTDASIWDRLNAPS